MRAGTNTPYHNVYILKFAFVAGMIAPITQYASPITFVRLIRAPVG